MTRLPAVLANTAGGSGKRANRPAIGCLVCRSAGQPVSRFSQQAPHQNRTGVSAKDREGVMEDSFKTFAVRQAQHKSH